jgi:hypothetical protein
MWLWLGLAVAVWTYGGWWTLTYLGLPRQTATAEEACNFYVGTAPNNFGEYVRQCLADPAIEAGARQRYLSFDHELWWLQVWFWILLPIVPLLLVLGLMLARRLAKAVWRALHEM